MTIHFSSIKSCSEASSIMYEGVGIGREKSQFAYIVNLSDGNRELKMMDAFFSVTAFAKLWISRASITDFETTIHHNELGVVSNHTNHFVSKRQFHVFHPKLPFRMDCHIWFSYTESNAVVNYFCTLEFSRSAHTSY